MLRLSVVIVNWNVREDLRRCLSSVLASSLAKEMEVIVVDNASTDGSASMVTGEFPTVRLIINDRNEGFARACNRGIRDANGRYITLLNPDTEVHSRALEEMVVHLDRNPGAGLVAPRLLNEDGGTQPSRRRFPTPGTAFLESTVLQRLLPDHPLLQRYYMQDAGDDREQDIDWAVGACLTVRREVIERDVLLDEQFFMYSEEMDWCLRIKRGGWRIVYLPQAEVVHYGGRSADQDVAARHILFHSSKVHFFSKYHGARFGELLRCYLLATYLFQGAEEALKLALGHKATLRRERLALIRAVLRSRLRSEALCTQQEDPQGPTPRAGNEIDAGDYIAGGRPTPRPPTKAAGRTGNPRIMFVAAEFPPKRGGVGDYTEHLAQALSEKEVEVAVVTSPPPYSRAKQESEHHQPYAVRRAVKNWNWGCWEPVRREIGTFHPDVVSIQYQTGAYAMHPAVNLLPLRLQAAGECPLISTTFHDLLLPYLFPKAGRIRELANYALERYSDCLVLTNEEDWWRLAPRWRPKAHLMPIGSNIAVRTTADFSARSYRARLGVLDDQVLLVNFGFLNVDKGIDVLFHALRLLKDEGRRCGYKLLMLGQGSGDSSVTHDDHEQHLRCLARDLGLEADIVWAGYLPPEEISACLLSADVGVFPFREGASLRRGSLVAALAHGLPVVTTCGLPTRPVNQLRFPRLVDTDNVLTARPGDPQSVAAAIRRLAGDGALREHLSLRAREMVDLLSWDRIAGTLLDYYQARLAERVTSAI